MDIVAVSQAVAALVASGAGKELAEDAGRGLAAAVVGRLRKVFGSDRRSVDALEQAGRSGSPESVEELAAALRWYARQDAGFAAEMARWAEQADVGQLHQEVRAGRDAYTAGRDQAVVNYPRPGQ